jgi:hypothetical protein
VEKYAISLVLASPAHIQCAEPGIDEVYPVPHGLTPFAPRSVHRGGGILELDY